MRTFNPAHTLPGCIPEPDLSRVVLVDHHDGAQPWRVSLGAFLDENGEALDETPADFAAALDAGPYEGGGGAAGRFSVCWAPTLRERLSAVFEDMAEAYALPKGDAVEALASDLTPGARRAVSAFVLLWECLERDAGAASPF